MIFSLFPLPSRLAVSCERLTSLLALLILLSFLLPETHAAGQSRPEFLEENVTYLWPTNASRYMSSSFGETRSAHFHAAMDIGTWGHEGHPVFATRDGTLHRVAVGPVGYGNVIYLRHNDGSISLYAHLKDFQPEIRAIVDSLRFLDYSFVFDEYLEDHNIRFRRGEQIGWTGSTGVGPPHLHFELRTPDGQPFNPLLAGIRLDDTIPPQFSGMSVEPLTPNSEINGSTGIHRIRPNRIGGNYDFGTLNVKGEIGLGVNVFDRANASNNVHAVYELEMYVNDERYFHSRVDSFSYGQSRQMFLDSVFPILQSERKGFQRLYIRNGNTLPFYENTGHSGRLDLPEGRHHIRIVASDFFGNTSRANLVLNVLEADSAAIQNHTVFPVQYLRRELTDASRYADAGSFYADEPEAPYTADFLSQQHHPRNVYWHKNWVRSTRSRASTADVSEIPYGVSDQLAIIPLGSFRDEMTYFFSDEFGLPLDIADRMTLLEGAHRWKLHRIRPQEPVTIFRENMRISVHFPVNTFFEPITVGITAAYPGFTLFPGTEPFNRPAAVRILLDENLIEKPGIGLYKINPSNGNESRVSSYIDPETNELVASISSGGTFTINSDTVGPDISSPKIGKWNHVDRHYVTVSVEDDRSGIDYRSAYFEVNGVRGIAEYDPEKKLLRYHHPAFRPDAENEITVRISDRTGNTVEKTFTGVRYN